MSYRDKYLIKSGREVRLEEWDPGETGEVADKKSAKAILKENHKRLGELQYQLYAEGKRSVLIILQAMDAGGKDGTIRHVMGPLNPQGCRVRSFKKPTEEELDHDFLWRIHRAAPRKGEIGIFNRSHYEDVLIVRVHNLVEKKVWAGRYDAINAFERQLAEAGTHILKFYLHISKKEQLKRFQARLDDPSKHWKVNPQDYEERKHWDDYREAYEAALGRCSTEYGPWFVIPANRKWYRNLVISNILVETLEGLDMEYPPPCCDISKIKIE